MKSLVLTLALVMQLWGGAATQQVAQLPLPLPSSISVAVGTEGTTIDPAYLTRSDGGDYLRHIYEGLMKYAPVSNESVMNEMSVTYGLAERVECSEDGLTYRFILREDALWSDGVPVRAEDFVYGWTRLLAAGSYGGKLLGDVLEHLEATEEKTLLVTLKRPCAYFLKLCAESYAAPVRRDLVERYGGDWTDAAHLAVTGAYTVRHWVHDDHMVLEKNPLYYDASHITPREITWYFRENAAVDFAVNPAAAAKGRAEGAGVYYLYLNANGIPDWRVRAAMLLVLDREAIAAAAGNRAVAAEGLVPVGISDAAEGRPMLAWLQETYTDYDLTVYEGRCALALELYNQAVGAGAWSHNRSLRFRCSESPLNGRVTALCRQNWLEVLGLKVTVEEMWETDYETMLRTNTFDVACLTWLPDYDDPLTYLRIMERGGSHNFSAWGDVRYNDLLRSCEEASHNRSTLLRQTEAALFQTERFAICPVFWYGESYYAAEGIRGVGHSAYGGYWFGNTLKEQ